MFPMAKILIVEDEGILAITIKNELIKMGHEVVGIANNGNKAIEMADKMKPDIILMDIVLKGSMNGIKATGEIRKDNDCKIIYMTAHTDEITLDAAKKTTHAGLLFKPFEPFQMKQALDAALK